MILPTLDLLIIVGLTGVGKSTTVDALKSSAFPFLLLPNRRELTDVIIIPEMQLERGESPRMVADRLERFELTRRYRRKHTGGMAYALQYYLGNMSSTGMTVVFDNLRGLEEVQYAAEHFPNNTRFIFFDAPDKVRLQRLLERRDEFDRLTTDSLQEGLAKALQRIEGLEQVFSLEDLLSYAEEVSVEQKRFVNAVQIIVKENQNYDNKAAQNYLRHVLDFGRYLYINTGTLTVGQVEKTILRWLG
jgi:guanylate kinase